METREHTEVGNRIRVLETNNPYLVGGVHEAVENPNPLTIRLMQLNEHGFPCPLETTLTSGEIVACAGDYYTHPGWADEFWLPENVDQLPLMEQNRQVVTQPVNASEQAAFFEAFNTLANESVTREQIDKIYEIEEKQYISSAVANQIIQQVEYQKILPHYLECLKKNEAHFTPWSTRAYIIGHQQALQTADIARQLHALAQQEEISLCGQVEIIQNLVVNRELSTLGMEEHGQTCEDIYKELAHRYHALAVAMDCYTLHFYSDHFAAGHISRLNSLRKRMPEKFGMIGSLLVNAMHNEDNTDSVSVMNALQFDPNSEYPVENFSANGDGTFDRPANEIDKEYCINGMTASVADINEVVNGASVGDPNTYSGLEFLPIRNNSIKQPQPLLIEGTDGKIYYRSPVKTIHILSPEQYEETLDAPQEHGYRQLTHWNMLKVLTKLRGPNFLFGQATFIDESIDEVSGSFSTIAHTLTSQAPTARTTSSVHYAQLVSEATTTNVVEENASLAELLSTYVLVSSPTVTIDTNNPENVNVTSPEADPTSSVLLN